MGKTSKASKALLNDLQNTVESLDSFLELFVALRATILDDVVDGDSSHGIYIRKQCLGFDQLAFESVGHLWTAFRQYVDAANIDEDDVSSQRSLFCSSSMLRMSIDIPNEEKEPTRQELDGALSVTYKSKEYWPLPSYQLERVLQDQCLALEGRIGIQSFEDTEMEITRVLGSYPELPAAHFLRFLNCMHHGERVGALDSLHRYFDYAMIHERKELANNGGDPNRKSIVQYAAVLLAALHTEFGNEELAFKATEEAVRVAQQGGDGPSVAYALGWLHQISGNNHNFAEEVLRRCASRAADRSLPSLAAGAAMSLASYMTFARQSDTSYDEREGSATIGAQSGPAEAWIHLASATTEQGTASGGAGGGLMQPHFDAPTRTANMMGGSDSMQLRARQNLIASGIWDAYGNMPMSALFSFQALYCYGRKLSSHEGSVAGQKIAMTALYGNGSHTLSLSCDYQGDALYNRMQTIGKERGGQNHMSFVGMQPKVYVDTLKQLLDMTRKQPTPSNGIWSHSVTMILHEWAVRRCELNHARSLTYVLHSVSSLPSLMQNGIEAKIQTSLQLSSLLCREKSWERAKQLILGLCTICQQRGLRFLRARLLLQLVMIHLECSPQRPVCALLPLLECLSICEADSMDSLHASCLCLLAKVHLQLDNVQRARALLKGSLPTLLQHAPIWFQGEAWLTLAKCHLREARDLLSDSEASSRNLGCMRLWKTALEQLNQSANLFESMDDALVLREVYYLQAQIYNYLPGHRSQRNAAATKYSKVCKDLLQSHSPMWQNVLESITLLDMGTNS
eukprot:scaffold43805_cov59-Attheya_sp.AAC.1